MEDVELFGRIIVFLRCLVIHFDILKYVDIWSKEKRVEKSGYVFWWECLGGGRCGSAWKKNIFFGVW